MKILAIAGSLKRDSTNARLLGAVARLAPPGAHFDHLAQEIGDIPHFRPELDEEGAEAPAAVADLRRRLAGADALVISCPEYAHGVPGAFKNALDWIVSSSETAGKPTALLMAGPGGARNAWKPLAAVLRVMGCDLVFEASLVVAGRHFDADGNLVDDGLRAEARRALAALGLGAGD